MRLPFLLVCATAVLVPLASFQNDFRWIKTSILWSTASLGLAAWTILRRLRPQVGNSRPPSWVFAVAILLISLGSLAWAENPYLAYDRVLLTSGGILLYLLAALSVTSWNRVARVGCISLIAGAAVAAYGLLQFYQVARGPSFASGVENPASTCGNSNLASEYLVTVAGLGFFAAVGSARRASLLAGGCAWGAIFWYLTISRARGSWLGLCLGLAVGCVLFAAKTGIQRKSRWSVITLVVCVIAGGTILQIAPGRFAKTRSLDSAVTSLQVKQGGIQSTEGSIQARLEIWQAAAAMFLERPLLGAGIGSFEMEAARHLPMGIVQRSIAESHRVISEAHNEYLQVAAETGLVGLLALALLVRAILRASTAIHASELTARERLLFCGTVAGLVASFVTAFFEFPWQVPASAASHWLLIGLLDAQLLLVKEQRRQLVLESPRNGRGHEGRNEGEACSTDSRLRPAGKRRLREAANIVVPCFLSLQVAGAGIAAVGWLKAETLVLLRPDRSSGDRALASRGSKQDLLGTPLGSLVVPLYAFRSSLARNFHAAALSLKNQGKLDLAEKWLDAAIEVDPRAYLFYYHRGIVRFNQAKYASAETDGESSAALAPHFSPARHLIAEARFELGDKDGALEAYRAAIQDLPFFAGYMAEPMRGIHVERRDCAALLDLACKCSLSGAFREARATLACARDVCGNAGEVAYQEAVLLAAEGRLNEALDALEGLMRSEHPALDKAPSDPAFKLLRDHQRFKELTRAARPAGGGKD